jgi:hypothetical protein
MEEKIKKYVEDIFVEVPQTKKASDLKEEILSNLIDKYNDLKTQGKTEEESYKIAIASVGDVKELTSNLKEDVTLNYASIENRRKKSALFISIAVGLYVCSFIPVILADAIEMNDSFAVVLMFLMWGVATTLLVYNYNTRPVYVSGGETMVEEFKEWKNKKENTSTTLNSINSAFWYLVCAEYFIFSFLTGSWYISWVIFIIGGCIQNVIKAIVEE